MTRTIKLELDFIEFLLRRDEFQLKNPNNIKTLQHLRINQLLHLTTDFEFEFPDFEFELGLPDFEFELGYLVFLLKNKFHLKNRNELPNLIRLIKLFHCTLVMKD